MNDDTPAALPADVSYRYPIPGFTTWWCGDHFRAVHDDGTVITARTYRELVVRCFQERTRRMGIEIQPGVYLLGVDGDHLSGPGG